MAPTSLRVTADLRLERGPTPLALAVEQAFAAALDDTIHLVAQAPDRRVHHVAIDAHGPGPLLELPLAAPTGIAACADAAFVTGWTAASTAVVVRVTGGGATPIDIPTSPPLHIWPRPLCVGGAPWLIWTSGDPATVHLGTPAGPARALGFADDTDQLDAVGDDRGLWLARLHGPDRRLALARVEGGTLVAEHDIAATRPTAPSLARVGDGVVLSWIEAPTRLCVQQFDDGGHPQAPAATLDASPQDGPFDGARLVAAPDGAVAVLAWSRTPLGDPATLHRPDGTTTRVAPRRETRLRVLAYDTRAHHLGPPHAVSSDPSAHAAAWRAGSLHVVHAGPDAAAQLSVFAPIAPP